MSGRNEYTNDFPVPQLPAPRRDTDRYPPARRGNFVEPAPRRDPPVTVDAVPQWVVPQGDQVQGAWDAQKGAVERTSAMDRAQAVRVRVVPFLWTWAGVGLVVGGAVWLLAGKAPEAALLGALVFAALTGWTYYRLNRTDYDYSREGTERHRITTAADLERARMQHEQELRAKALDAYLQQLNGRER